MVKHILISLLFVLYAILLLILQSPVFAQDTIIMPQTGARSVQLQPCKKYVILDPGGNGNYPAGCNSALFLWTTAKRMRIEGSYTVTAIQSSSANIATFYAETLFFLDSLLQGVDNYSSLSRTYPSQTDAGSYTQIDASTSTVSGNISVSSITGYATIMFRSAQDQQGAAGFELVVTVEDGEEAPIADSLVANIIDATSASLSWNDLAQDGSGWTIYYGTDEEHMQNIPANSTSKILNNLQPNTQYYYIVSSNAIGFNSDDVGCKLPRGSFITPAMPSTQACVNFLDLESDNVHCYYGNYADPKVKEGKIDYGESDIQSRHTVVTTSSIDSRTQNGQNGLKTIPDGETSSIRLGNWNIGAQSECVSYQYKVDTDQYDMLLLKYAVVLQEPNHAIALQPMFQLSITDETGQEINPNCLSAMFIPGQNTNDWNVGNQSNILWKDWSTIGVDISRLHGRTIYINLITRDCLEAAHYGYAYYVMRCGRKEVEIASCGNEVENTFTLPEGFAYRWYRSDNESTTLSETRQLHVSSEGTYICNLSFLAANGNETCDFTLQAIAGPHYPFARFNTQQTEYVNCKKRVKLKNNSIITIDEAHLQSAKDEGGMEYQWIIDGEPYDGELTYYDFTEGSHTVSLVAFLSNRTCTDTASTTFFIDGMCQVNDPNRTIVVCDSLIPLTIFGKPITTAGTHTIDSANHTIEVTIEVKQSKIEHITGYVLPDAGPPGYMFHDQYFLKPIDTIFYHLHTIDGCDSMLRLSLIACRNIDTTIYRNVCDNGFPYHYDNQTYTTAGTHIYQKHIPCGADSNITLILTERPTYSDNIYDTICSNQNRTLSGQTFNTNGTHSASHNSIYGCDSLELLHLKVWPSYDINDTLSVCAGDTITWTDSSDYSAPVEPRPYILRSSSHGCDSVLHLSLIVLQPSVEHINMTVLEDNLPTFTYNDISFTSDVSDTLFILTNSAGCDSLIHFSLYVNRNQDTVVNIQLCENEFPYYRDGYKFDSAGIYPYTIYTQQGADSNIILVLNKNKTYLNDIYVGICDGEHHFQSGQYYSTEGIDTIPLHTNQNCDSVEVLHLVVHPTYDSIDYNSVCRGHSLRWHNDSVYYQYTYPLPTIENQTVYGCDSNLHLYLTIHDSSYHITDETVCDTFTWRGTIFYASDTVIIHGLTNGYGCPHTEILYLRINYSNSSTDTIIDCDKHVWHGRYYNASNNTDTITIRNAAGCDSLITLDLTILHSVQNDYYDTFCSNETYTRSGETFSSGGYYYIRLQGVNGCDSIERLHLKTWPIFATTDHQDICRGDTMQWIDGMNYYDIDSIPHSVPLSSIHGCDSTSTLSLTVHDTTYGSTSIYVPEDQLPTFRFYGSSFRGDVEDTVFMITNTAGCDSILQFSLRVCYNHDSTVERTVCENDYPCVFDGFIFYDTGTFNYTIYTYCGADSNLTMHLAKYPSYRDAFYDTICDNQFFQQSGHEFHTDGIHDIMLRSIHDCDSVEEIHLTVWPTYAYIDHQAFCRGDTLLWDENEQSYTDTISPSPMVAFQSIHTCDSTITLSIRIKELSYETVHDVTLENDLPFYRYNNVAFDSDMVDTIFLLTNQDGCDSVIHFSLYVARNHDTTIYLSICSGVPATFMIEGNRKRFRQVGTTTFTISTHEGADSVINITCSEHDNSNVFLYDTICDAIQSGLGNNEIIRQRQDQGYNIYGCDSITTIRTTVHPINNEYVTDMVLENDLPQPFLYATFSEEVEDSTFHLTNIWDCDSFVHYTLIICRNTDTTLYDTTCDTELPILWNGVSFSDTTSHFIQLYTHCGADSNITMTLNIKYSNAYNDEITACDSFVWHGHTYTSSNHTDTVHRLNSVGCDSLTTLYLSLYYSYRFSYYDTLCDNQTFSQSGHTFNTEGMHVIPLTSIHNCDSIENIYLKVWPTLTSIDSVSICRGDTLLWQDDSNYFDIITPAPHVLYRSEHDCDSTVTLKLTFNELSYNSERAIVTENDLPTYRYNNAGFATDVEDTVFILKNAVGCDSILHFSLYVCRNVDSAIKREVCDNVFPLNWNDTTFEHGGLLTLHRTNWCGADSTVFLTLNVHRTYLNKHYDTICDNQHLFWENQVFTTTGMYNMCYLSRFACDSTERLYLKVHPTYDDTDHIVLCWGKTLRWIDSVDYTYRPINYPKFYMQSIYRCDSIRTLDIIKTHPISSDLFVEPDHPSWENPEIQITDISRNVCRREWYISGRFLDTSQSVTYHFNSTDVEALIKLVLFDNYGCVDTVTRRIHFDRAGLWVTNIFTPNRYENSVMRIDGENINELECYVYTRQGHFIYKFNSINDTWDGTYHGTPCPQATYTYIIRYTTIHDPKSWLTKKGTVTLLR